MDFFFAFLFGFSLCSCVPPSATGRGHTRRIDNKSFLYGRAKPDNRLLVIEITLYTASCYRWQAKRPHYPIDFACQLGVINFAKPLCFLFQRRRKKNTRIMRDAIGQKLVKRYPHFTTVRGDKKVPFLHSTSNYPNCAFIIVFIPPIIKLPFDSFKNKPVS